MFLAVLFCCCFVEDVDKKREKAVPMSASHRRMLKDFIMRKEAAVLAAGECPSQHERDAILEMGAVDCLYGLHELYQKILSSEQESEISLNDNLSAAGWLKAIQRSDNQAMDAEEKRIAQVLFDAADLDSAHSITFTEFAMLAVLLSATDASDADAQVRAAIHSRMWLARCA